MSRLAFAALGSTALLALTAPARADEAAADDAQVIIVIGQAHGYNADQSVTATKTDTPLLDVPQSIQVVTRARLDDQASRSLADVLRYVPGATIGQGEGNRDQVTLRGQNTTADFFLDGVRDDVQYYRGLYNIERVEILKGPYALIFGRGGGGGIINRVQKTPHADGFKASASASASSFGAWDLAADVNLSLGNATALRVNGTYEQFDNHRDFYEGERYAVNPYFAATLGEGWSLGLSYEYVHDDRVTDRGVPSIATTAGQPNEPLRGFDKQFFGVPGINRSRLEAHIAKARIDGELADNLKFTATALYGDYDKIYANVYANSAANSAATSSTGSVALDAYSDPTTRQNFIAQTNLLWDVATGGADHKLLFGLEYGSQQTANQRLGRVFTPGSSFNLAAPVFPAVTFTAPTRNTQSDVRFFSAYAQDQISFGAHFDVVVGIRYDRFRIEGTDFILATPRPFGRTDEKVSPRIGLIYKPQENISIYASYSKSFQPRSGDQFISLTTVQEGLTPEEFTNYEIGAKWDIHSGINLTLALFQLDRINTGVPDPNIPNQEFLTDTRTRGFELALTGRITSNWQMSGGYTYQDAYRKADQSVQLGQVPKHNFALWNRYDFDQRFGIGMGVVHQSSQYAAIRTSPTTTRLPGFTRVDAALYWRPSDRFDLQLNVENLFDADYFSDAHNNNNISPGAPINARLTARVKF